MLDNHETYRHLQTNPTVSKTKDVNKFINNFLETKKITKEASFKLKYLDATTTRLYGLPKLHKENIPQRPIASFHRPTYLRITVAKELSSYWNHLLKNQNIT